MNNDNPVAQSIRHSIEKNGFPEKSVNLPFRPVFESCKEHGSPLAEVLKQLGEEGVIGTIKGDQILFQTPEKASASAAAASSAKTGNDDPMSFLDGLSGGVENIVEWSKQALAKMSPDQIRELRQTFENMSPHEREQYMTHFSELFKDPGKK